MGKKYELIEESTTLSWVKLYRIKALRSFGDVKKGELGGFIEKEDNLSHEGLSWVSGYGRVCDNGKVYGNGKVYDNGEVCGNGRVYDNGLVYGYGKVYDNGLVYDNGKVCGNGLVYGYGRVYDNGLVYGYGRVCDNGKVYGNGRVSGSGLVYGSGRVCDNGKVSGYGRVSSGYLTVDMMKDIKSAIACALNIYPINGYYYLYKRVNKVSDGVYASCYDGEVLYNDGKVTRVKDYNPDKTVSCSRGIHASAPFYYTDGDTLIAVKVKEYDVITCLDGKVRCKAVTTIGEINTKQEET